MVDCLTTGPARLNSSFLPKNCFLQLFARRLGVENKLRPKLAWGFKLNTNEESVFSSRMDPSTIKNLMIEMTCLCGLRFCVFHIETWQFMSRVSKTIREIGGVLGEVSGVLFFCSCSRDCMIPHCWN